MTSKGNHRKAAMRSCECLSNGQTIAAQTSEAALLSPSSSNWYWRCNRAPNRHCGPGCSVHMR